MRDDLSGLQALLAVADKKSFTKAAIELGVTPSAVSQTIRALEDRLGVRLLQRTTRSVGLSEAGERFVARLTPALGAVRAAFESLDELRNRPAGTLRITVSRHASRGFIEPLLASFLEAYPEVALDVSIDDGLTNIVADGFDVGIRLGEALEQEMVAVRIGDDERLAVVGSPAYFAQHPKPKHPRDLLGHSCIGYRRIRQGTVYRWEFTENGKDFEIGITGRLTTNDADLMVRAALDGVGLACTVESVLREHMENKRLVRVLEAFTPPFTGFFLYYPSRVNLSPKLEAFIGFMKRARRRRHR